MSQHEHDQTYLAERVKITEENRLYVPSQIRDMASIGPGDVLDIRLLPAEEDSNMEAVVCLDLIVNKGMYVTIPKYKRRVYGIDPPVTVHADIQTTGRTVELDDE